MHIIFSRITRRLSLLFLSALVFISVSACQSVQMNTPPGFVHYHKQSHPYRAITAEGVRLRVQIKENQPKGDAELWRQMLEKNLQNQGYIIHKKGIVDNPTQKGKYLISLYNYNKKDFAYLIAVFTKGDNLYLCEAAGPYEMFQKKQVSIFNALQTLQVN